MHELHLRSDLGGQLSSGHVSVCGVPDSQVGHVNACAVHITFFLQTHPAFGQEEQLPEEISHVLHGMETLVRVRN